MSTPRIQHRPVEVSIIIPVFNKAELTEQCLQALARCTGGVSHEIIVVDNASTDATPRLLARRRDVRCIRNESNRGFAVACNQGAAAARGPLLLFLNNDTVAFPNWLMPLVEELRLHPDVVAVGSKLLFKTGLVQHAGVAFGRETRSPFHPYRGLLADDPRVNRRRELQAVTAACMLIRREWFERCGRFNEQYRNGYEDLDLCLHIRRRGGIIVYQPKSTLYHLESQTAGRMQLDDANRALFFSKWADWLLADEDAYYLADDYKMVFQREEERRVGCLVPLATEAERAAWTVVARTQRLAAEGKWDEVRALLQNPEVWPNDAAVRQWAAAVCFRFGPRAAAHAHLRKSLELEPSPEALLQLAQSEPPAVSDWPMPAVTSGPDDPSLGLAAVADMGQPEPDGSEAGGAGAGVRQQLEGVRLFLAGDYARAGEAFEQALLQGGDAREALIGMAAAALKAGDLAAARQCCDALCAQRKGDPLAGQLLKLIETAETNGSASGATAPAASTLNPPPKAVQSPPPAQPAPAETPVASILILVLNQLEHTRRCLDSLAAHTRLPHEIIVVDNGSQDGTPEFLREWLARTPHGRVIRNKTNRGFAAGNNQALALARGQHVVLLNNDTVVTPGWLERMLAVLRRHPNTGIVGPMSNCVCGPQLATEVGYTDINSLPAFAERWALQHAGQAFEVPRAVGFCLLARREVIERIGGLDERFGSGNFEDDDFCLRARFAGFSIRIARDVFIHHVGSQTFKGAKIDYRQAMLRNWELFRAKWQLPAASKLEHGYRVPAAPPPGLSLVVPLRSLADSHESADGQVWVEKAASQAATANAVSVQTDHARPGRAAPLKLPACAWVGHLGEARDLLRQRKLPAAWAAAVAALQKRPFHPEAFLLLAEIAQAAGDGVAARCCAEHARRIAPAFKAARQFLKQRFQACTRPSWLVLPEQVQHADAARPGRLSVCLIVKNEERFLGQCLRSVRDLANQVIVVDTGSTDRTVEIARQHGAEVYPFAWCDDFSAARNAALEHATGDWVLMLDADEELCAESRPKLLAALSQPTVMAWRLPIVDVGHEAEGCSYVPRLFRNAPGLFYVGRVHEQVFSSLEVRRAEWGLENRLGDARLLHHGYTAELTRDRDKVQRNLRLLEQAVAEMPNEPHLLMHLGLELARAGREPEALTRYREAFQSLSAKPAAEVVPELRETLLTQLSARLTAARQFDEIVRVLASPLATEHGGLTASLHFARGLAHLELGQYHEAAEHMRQCLAKRNEPCLTPIHRDIRTAAPHHCLAVALAKLGDVAGAEQAFRAGLQDAQPTAALRLDYARFLHEQRRPVEALQQLHALISQDAAHAEAWRLGGRIALGQPAFLEFARDWTGEALRYQAGDPVLTAQRAEALMLSGDVAGALPLWKQACNGHPQPTASAARILCEVIESPTVSPLPANTDETVLSRAFLDWYRKLIQTHPATVHRLNERVTQLAGALPSAARVLQAAMAEADHPEAVHA